MTEVRFRIATEADLAAILHLIDEDAIARSRPGHGTGITPSVRAAFTEIAADPNQELWVGERAGEIVATLQLTLIPGLSRGGLKRALVEAVRVRTDQRGNGVGAALMQAVMDRARARGAGMIQLTTDKRRHDAHRFYARLGFEASHEGMKRML